MARPFAEQGAIRIAGAQRQFCSRGDGARLASRATAHPITEAAKITGWQANYPVAGYRVDVGFPAQTDAVEVDGLAFHTDSEDFQQDRIRQNAIALAGWQGCASRG